MVCIGLSGVYREGYLPHSRAGTPHERCNQQRAAAWVATYTLGHIHCMCHVGVALRPVASGESSFDGASTATTHHSTMSHTSLLPHHQDSSGPGTLTPIPLDPTPTLLRTHRTHEQSRADDPVRVSCPQVTDIASAWQLSGPPCTLSHCEQSVRSVWAV